MKSKIVLFVSICLLVSLVSCTEDKADREYGDLPSIGIKAIINEEKGQYYLDIDILNSSEKESSIASFSKGNLFKYEVINNITHNVISGVSIEEGSYVINPGENFFVKILIGTLDKGDYQLIVETITNEGTIAKHKSDFNVIEGSQTTEIINDDEEETSNEIINAYQVNWHFVHYYGIDEAYLDTPFTDVYLVSKYNDIEEKIKVGTYIGFASVDHVSTISHLEAEDFITGWQSYYSGGGVFVYLTKHDDRLFVMQHQLEEAIDEEVTPIPDIEINKIELPAESVVVNNPVTIERVIYLNIDNKLSVDNWMNHSRIKEIREIYNNIQSDISSELLTNKRKDLSPAENHGIYSKSLYLNKDDNVRKYVVEVGSDDSALTIEYYYDNNNVLRFIFISGGAVNGTYIEHRVYLDSEGNKFWEIQKIEGLGYPFFDEYLKDQYMFDPLDVFEDN